jgi:hypothetical protein
MVRKLYGDSLASEQHKKETENGHSEEPGYGVQVRLHHHWRMPLQSLHLQELQLLSTAAANGAPGGTSGAHR